MKHSLVEETAEKTAERKKLLNIICLRYMIKKMCTGT